MTGKKDMVIVKFGEHYLSLRVSEQQPQGEEQIILCDGSSIYGEYIDGIFVVQSYDLDSNEKPDMINQIAMELCKTYFTNDDTEEIEGYILVRQKDKD